MKVTYRHQCPAMQYGVAEFTLEDDVHEGQVDATMQAMVQHCERLFPWPPRRDLAPHNDPVVAEPRPSGAQRKQLLELARRIETETSQPPSIAPPTTAAEADAQIRDLTAALDLLQSTSNPPPAPEYPAGANMAAKDRRCSKPHRPPVLLSIAEHDYSVAHMGRPLCRACQAEERARQ